MALLQDMSEAIGTLTKKAKDSHDANEAMKFSQAALNLAHAKAVTFGKY